MMALFIIRISRRNPSMSRLRKRWFLTLRTAHTSSHQTRPEQTRASSRPSSRRCLCGLLEMSMKLLPISGAHSRMSTHQQTACRSFWRMFRMRMSASSSSTVFIVSSMYTHKTTMCDRPIYTSPKMTSSTLLTSARTQMTYIRLSACLATRTSLSALSTRSERMSSITSTIT